MKLVCPSCGAACAAEAWANDAEARQALKIAAELPESVSRRAIGYMALFRPMTGRGLKWATVLKHLAELERLVREPFVQWEQRPARPNDSRFWGQAMERLIECPPKKLPLKSHGYMRAIVYEIADDSDREKEKQTIAAGKPLPQKHRGDSTLPQISADEMRRVRERKGL